MSEKNVQDYLDHGMYGTPQLKPEEKQQYLGNFRERVSLAVKKSDVKRLLADNLLAQELQVLPHGKLFIHSLISSDVLQKCIQICKKNNYPFTIVTRDSQPTNETICLVIASTDTLNITKIDLEEKYPSSVQNTEPSTRHTGFFAKIFGKF